MLRVESGRVGSGRFGRLVDRSAGQSGKPTGWQSAKHIHSSSMANGDFMSQLHLTEYHQSDVK